MLVWSIWIVGDWDSAAGIVTVLKKEHKNFYASNIFLSDSNRVAPHIHRRRSKGAVRSC